MSITSLEITTKIGCSNNCSYCPQDLLVSQYNKRSGIKYMTFDTFKECIDKLDERVEIHFTGMCEPFLNNECIDMMEYCHPHNVRVSTTLIGLELKDIKRLEYIDFIAFDVHLPAKTGDSIPVNDKYLELLEAVAKSNIKNIDYHYHDGECAIDSIEAYRVISHSRAGNIKDKQTKLLTGAVKCIRKHKCPVLLPNGDIFLCCMDYGLEHFLGNLTLQSIDEIYRGRGFKKLIKETKKQSGSICHACDYGYIRKSKKDKP